MIENSGYFKTFFRDGKLPNNFFYFFYVGIFKK